MIKAIEGGGGGWWCFGNRQCDVNASLVVWEGER